MDAFKNKRWKMIGLEASLGKEEGNKVILI
jgi:hypothetical protein